MVSAHVIERCSFRFAAHHSRFMRDARSQLGSCWSPAEEAAIIFVPYEKRRYMYRYRGVLLLAGHHRFSLILILIPPTLGERSSYRHLITMRAGSISGSNKVGEVQSRCFRPYCSDSRLIRHTDSIRPQCGGPEARGCEEGKSRHVSLMHRASLNALMHSDDSSMIIELPGHPGGSSPSQEALGRPIHRQNRPSHGEV